MVEDRRGTGHERDAEAFTAESAGEGQAQDGARTEDREGFGHVSSQLLDRISEVDYAINFLKRSHKLEWGQLR